MLKGNQITPRGSGLIVAKLAKKLPILCGIGGIIAVSTISFYWFQS
jgi:hypothetical protein